MKALIPVLCLYFTTCFADGAPLILDKFPQSFAFGVSSSAFPTEGAWNEDGKGSSIWDEFTTNSANIQGGGNAKIAADGYHSAKADVQLLKGLGVSHYKFSLSWARLLPSGTVDSLNSKGFGYYNGLINDLLANSITPFVTLHHWDLPQKLQEKGGWTNESSILWFKDYADLCFKTFGDRVKLWTTIDDPVSLAYKGHETGEHAPGLKRPDLVYAIGHNLIRAHVEAYILYRDTYSTSQKGQVGISLNSDWFVAKSKDASDVSAAERALAFQLGWFADPLFNGDYPSVMKEHVALRRAQKGVLDQKIPDFTAAEKRRVKGATDFLAIGHFKTKIVSQKANTGKGFLNDQDVLLETDKTYPKLEYRPEINPDSDKRLMGFGLKDLLNHVTTKYSNPGIYVTQNGLETCGTLKDQNRIEYIREYSNNVLQAINAGSDVRGYFVWSLVDGFDWNLGYTNKTGLYFVDMGVQGRPRYQRSSATFYKALIANRGLNENLQTYRAYPADRDEFYYGKFPDNFLWGVSTSAYQIEGGWNADGKGPSIWDTFTHENRLASHATGDVACDSYHLYNEDVKMMENLGVDFYRFSISWSRVMPDGTMASVNQAGIDYYNRLIDALLAKNISAMATLHHWDLPQALQDHYGGWMNDSIVDLFGAYARLCFENFGNRVKYWLTFNEPSVISSMGYGTGAYAPGIIDLADGAYKVAHNIIRSHTRAYHIYKDNFKSRYGGNFGIPLDIEWKEPLTDSLEDAMAAYRALEFKLGWFANPIYAGSGDYPQVMKDYIGTKSRHQGLAKSRLPEFTDAEKQQNKGSYDFLGINQYTSQLVGNKPDPNSPPNYELDQDVDIKYDPCWGDTATGWHKFNPWGIRKVVTWAKEHFNNTPIFITESGRSSDPGLDDQDKIFYHKYYINEVLKAITIDKVDVRSYSVWSLMDDFEWTGGYHAKMGLYSVDFDSPNKTRTPRASATFYKNIIAENGFSKPIN